MPKSILDNDIDFDDIDIENTVPEQFTLPGIDKEIFVTTKPTGVIDTSKLTNCPRCGKPLIPAKAISGVESMSWLECPDCGTLVNTFKPTYYQAIYLRRPERYKMSAGGFGTGKSRVNIEDVIKHLLLIPGARVCVAARTYPALESTFVKEFYSMFPDKLIKRKNDQKHELTLTNGSELLFRSFDDPTKLKSMNLTMAVIVEASDVVYEGFTMMQSRIRNTAAMIPEYDVNGQPVFVWDVNRRAYRPKYRIDTRHISLETNPDSGWVKKNFLLDAETVDFFGDAYNEGYKFNKERDPKKYIQVVSTSANPYLPETYEEDQTRDKSPAYIAQFFKGSFNFSTGLVLPNVGLTIVPPKKLPREFDEEGRRLLWYAIGVDYGVNDPTHIVFTAFSTETRKLYVFNEYRVNDTDIKNIAKGYRKELRMMGLNLNGLFMLPRFDGRSYNKRESSLATIGSMFEDEGLYFDAAFEKMEPRIIKLNSLINHEQMEIWSTCEYLIDEMLNWKFKRDKLGNLTKEPEDKNDHGIQALAFVVVALPHNLKELKLSAYIPTGTKIIHDKKHNTDIKKKDPIYDPLSTEVRDARNTNAYGNNIIVNGTDRGMRAFSIYDETPDDSSGKNADNGEYEEEVVRPLSSYIPSGRY
jgi:hypothetical protein